jgi:hypothetical protein
LDRAVDAIARAQHLVDSCPQTGYPLAWYIEAMQVGDLSAIVGLLISRQAQLERLETALDAMPPETPLTIKITIEPGHSGQPHPSAAGGDETTDS